VAATAADEALLERLESPEPGVEHCVRDVLDARDRVAADRRPQSRRSCVKRAPKRTGVVRWPPASALAVETGRCQSRRESTGRNRGGSRAVAVGGLPLPAARSLRAGQGVVVRLEHASAQGRRPARAQASTALGGVGGPQGRRGWATPAASRRTTSWVGPSPPAPASPRTRSCRSSSTKSRRRDVYARMQPADLVAVGDE
jgi:hypothetical protein